MNLPSYFFTISFLFVNEIHAVDRYHIPTVGISYNRPSTTAPPQSLLYRGSNDGYYNDFYRTTKRYYGNYTTSGLSGEQQAGLDLLPESASVFETAFTAKTQPVT